jgi:hypothetical protein
MVRVSSDLEVRFGYTVDAVYQLARCAARTTPFSTILSPADREDIAELEILTCLLEASVPVGERELLRVGRHAIAAAARAERVTHGYDREDAYRGAGSATNFARYWRGLSGVTPSPEPAIVERLTLHQVWATLAPVHRDTLLALAVAGDHGSAAAMLGLPLSKYRPRLSRARAAFLRDWHQGETPSRVWGCDRRGAGRGGIGKLRRRAQLRQRVG